MSEASAGVPAGTRQVEGHTVPHPGIWVVDPAHSSFEFVARHLMLRIRGRFNKVTATAEIAKLPEESSVRVDVDASSVDTHEPTRDAHLRSAEFLDVRKYPKIIFRSTAIRAAGGNTWALDGELTIKDTTRSVNFDLEFLGAAVDQAGNSRIGFAATTNINREDWDLTWNTALEAGGFLLAREVRIEIEAGLIPKGSRSLKPFPTQDAV